jgi:hypothetical protein
MAFCNSLLLLVTSLLPFVTSLLPFETYFYNMQIYLLRVTNVTTVCNFFTTV